MITLCNVVRNLNERKIKVRLELEINEKYCKITEMILQIQTGHSKSENRPPLHFHLRMNI